MSKIIDCITYNGEKELFDLRYNILKDYVDEFIVVEFDKTFSGKDKPSYFSEIHNQYPKVRYEFIKEEFYNQYLDLAKSSPNTEYGKGAEHWIREFCQKESIKDCLSHLNDEHIVFIGDCDEIWNPDMLDTFKDWNNFLIKNDLAGSHKIQLAVYTYFLNQRSDEKFLGTIVAPYKNIKLEDQCLNILRTIGPYRMFCSKNEEVIYEPLGWHFTSMAPYLKDKLESSYTSDTYATEAVLNGLEENIKNNKDFLGRDFKYWADESEWPQYLKDNKEKYKHLLKN